MFALFEDGKAETAVMHLRLIEHGRRLVALYRQFFPREFAREGIDYRSAASVLDCYDRFAALVDRHLFPVWGFSESAALLDEPEHALMSMHLRCVSFAWFERDEAGHDLLPVEKLIVSAAGLSSFPGVTLGLGNGKRFDGEVLEEVCRAQRGPLRDLSIAFRATTCCTDNPWIDLTEEDWYQGEMPDWQESAMRSLATEWKEARQIGRRVKRFFDWVAGRPERLARVEALLRRAQVPMNQQRVLVQVGAGRPLVEVLA